MEKDLIYSEQYNVDKLCVIILAGVIIVDFILHFWWCGFNIGEFLGYIFDQDTYLFSYWITIVAGVLVTFITKFLFGKVELYVTDKRVYGYGLWGKRVDIPLDSISAVGISALKSITIASSSGRISFAFVKNRDRIHKTISDLLIDRQREKQETIIKQEIPSSNADELKKYKDLYDAGVITQEEFDAKKKQLLGL